MTEVARVRVTEVEITIVKPRNGLIAFASIVLDNQVFLSGIAIHRRLNGDGYRLTYPTRKVGDRAFDIFHPIRRPIGQAIETAILDKLNDVVSKSDAGHGSVEPGCPRL